MTQKAHSLGHAATQREAVRGDGDRMDETLPLGDLIPAAVRAAIVDRHVVMVEMAAGPGFVAVRIERFEPPRTLGEGIAVLERFRTTMRRGRVVLDNGRTLLFERHRFMSFK